MIVFFLFFLKFPLWHIWEQGRNRQVGSPTPDWPRVGQVAFGRNIKHSKNENALYFDRNVKPSKMKMAFDRNLKL